MLKIKFNLGRSTTFLIFEILDGKKYKDIGEYQLSLSRRSVEIPGWTVIMDLRKRYFGP